MMAHLEMWRSPSTPVLVRYAGQGSFYDPSYQLHAFAFHFHCKRKQKEEKERRRKRKKMLWRWRVWNGFPLHSPIFFPLNYCSHQPQQYPQHLLLNLILTQITRSWKQAKKDKSPQHPLLKLWFTMIQTHMHSTLECFLICKCMTIHHPIQVVVFFPLYFYLLTTHVI